MRVEGWLPYSSTQDFSLGVTLPDPLRPRDEEQNVQGHTASQQLSPLSIPETSWGTLCTTASPSSSAEGAQQARSPLPPPPTPPPTQSLPQPPASKILSLGD